MDILAAMRMFVRVVERGNLSRAARDLGVGQPTVSERIDRLERHLGVQLLRRNTRAVSCTDAGAVFYERSRRAIEAADDACDAVAPGGRTLTGLLRIAAPQGMGEVVLPRILIELRKAHPRLAIDLILNDQIVDPVTEGVDISLRVGQPGEGRYVVRRLGHVRRVLVASPGYLAQAAMPDSPDELIGHPFVRVMGLFGDNALHLQDDQGRRLFTRVTPVINMSHWRPVYESLLNGAGIGVLQETVCAQAMASGQLIRLLPRFTVPGFDLHALLAHPISEKARAAMALLEQAIPAALQPE